MVLEQRLTIGEPNNNGVEEEEQKKLSQEQILGMIRSIQTEGLPKARQVLMIDYLRSSGKDIPEWPRALAEVFLIDFFEATQRSTQRTLKRAKNASICLSPEDRMRLMIGIIRRRLASSSESRVRESGSRVNKQSFTSLVLSELDREAQLQKTTSLKLLQTTEKEVLDSASAALRNPNRVSEHTTGVLATKIAGVIQGVLYSFKR